MLCDLGEWQTPYHKAHLLCKTHTQSNHPQQDQNKSQCPEFLLHLKVPSFGVCRQLLSGHPGSLACSQLLPISGSVLEPACGASAAVGHASSSKLCTPRVENMPTHASPGGRESERVSFLEAMGHVAAKATWSMDRTGEFTI